VISLQLMQSSFSQLYQKRCACGCNQFFVPANSQQKYFDRSHRDRAYSRRYYKKNNIHKEYQGLFFCPKCGQIGSLFFLVRDGGIIMRIIIEHRTKEYSPDKRKKLLSKGYSSKQANNKGCKITKDIGNCYF